MSGRTRACGRAFTALAVVALAAAPPAAAQGSAPSASVTLVRGSLLKECLTMSTPRPVCGVFGTHRATVSWATACPDPAARRITEVDIRARQPGPTKWDYGSVAPADPDAESLPASGEADLPLLPGWKLYAVVKVQCYATEPEPAPEGPPAPVDELPPRVVVTQAQATITAESGTITAPPVLAGRAVAFTSYCARSPQQLQALKGKLQAGRPAWLRYYVRYATMKQHPVMGSPSSPGGLQGDRGRVFLHARGAGVKVRVRPNKSWMDAPTYSLEARVRARRAGTLRVWAAVDGVRTNVLKMKVVRGC